MIEENPIPEKVLGRDWLMIKKQGAHRFFVAYYKNETEYIYAFRANKRDIKPVYHLAVKRDDKEQYVNTWLDLMWSGGYLFSFDGKRSQGSWGEYFLGEERMERLDKKARIHIRTYKTGDRRYRFTAMCKENPKLKYIPENAFESAANDRDMMAWYGIMCEYPHQVEIFTKLGYEALCKQRAWLKCPKSELKPMLDYWDRSGKNLTFSMVKWNMRKGINAENAFTLVDMPIVSKAFKKYGMDRQSARKLTRYIDGEATTLGDYDEYYDLRKEMDLGWDESCYFPKGLENTLRKLRETKKVQKSKEISRKMGMIVFSPKSSRYVIAVPHSVRDLIDFGNELHDCLGTNGWENEIVAGKDFIFVICSKKTKEPIAACEIRPCSDGSNEIAQLYGDRNKEVSPALRHYVNTEILPQFKDYFRNFKEITA